MAKARRRKGRRVSGSARDGAQKQQQNFFKYALGSVAAVAIVAAIVFAVSSSSGSSGEGGQRA